MKRGKVFSSQQRKLTKGGHRRERKTNLTNRNRLQLSLSGLVPAAPRGEEEERRFPIGRLRVLGGRLETGMLIVTTVSSPGLG